MNASATTGFIWAIDLLSHLVRQRINGLLVPLSLTFPKYCALRVLEEKPALTNAELARACRVRPQTMNSIVRDLQEEGLLEQSTTPEHSLKLIYRLTPQAERVLKEAHRVVAALEHQFIVTLSEEKVREMQIMMAGTLQRLESMNTDVSGMVGSIPSA